MATNVLIESYVLAGDANRDRAVNLVDFNIFAANFGQSPRTFSQGDFNYDGLVNLADFNILAARFGTVLSATVGQFSDSKISESISVRGQLDVLN